MNTKLNQCNISNIDLSEVGNRWQVKGDRLYLSDDFKLKALGLEVQYYKTGSVSGATQDGEPISNSQATRLIEGCRRAWVDLETGELRDCTRSEAEERLVEAINAVVEEEEIREYWSDVEDEIDAATNPLTAVQYGWDPSAVITPENESIVMGSKKHFHILSMEDVQCLALNAKKVRGRIWPKVQAAMDTTKLPVEPWSIKPFVDEAVAEFVEEYSRDAETFTDVCGFEWKEDERTLHFQATGKSEDRHFFIKYDSRDRGTLKMITPGARWDETTISDEDQPGVRFCPVHRPGTGHDSEAEVKAFFEGRLFYWHRNELIYSFTR